MIREAVEADIPELVEMARAFHAASHYQDAVPFIAGDVASTLETLIADDDGVVLRHDSGLIAGVIAPFFFNAGYRQAIELMWYATRDGRALLTAFEAWANERRAGCIIMGSLSSGRESRVAEIYKRRGYVPGETLYIKRGY